MNIKKYYFKSKKTKINHKNSFSIITATYNCGQYLDDYFSAITLQNYPKDLLEIIIVDDGSNDNTKEIVDKYLNKLHINYVYQQNSGVASARNTGINAASNEFLSFIDADDMVDKEYFSNLNYSINTYPNASLYVSNLNYYFEKEKEIKNIHFLKYRFTKFKFHYQIDLLKHPEWFVVHMSSCVFKKSLVKNQVRQIKPQFEDAFFINEYLKDIDKLVVFNNKAKYLYRKRFDKSSTIDQVGTNSLRYVELLEDGYIALLELYEPNIPEYVKNVVYYDYKFNLEEFSNNPIEVDLERRNKSIKLIDQYLKK